MESIVFLVDNSTRRDSKWNNNQWEKELRQQLVAIDRISQHIWWKNKGNKVSVIEFSPKARVITDFTNDFNRLLRAMKKISLGIDIDFLFGLWTAIRLLKQSRTLSKRLVVFIRNYIKVLDFDLKDFCVKIIEKMSVLRIDIVLIGEPLLSLDKQVLGDNRKTLKPIEESMKNKTLNIFEVNKIDANEIVRQLFGQKVPEVSLSDQKRMEELRTIPLSRLGKPNEKVLKSQTNLTEDMVKRIDAQINAVQNDKTIDNITRYEIIRALEEDRNRLIASMEKTSVLKNPNPVQENDKDLEEAIKASFKENYKTNTSDKGLSDASKQSKQQNSSKEVNKNDKKNKKVKKYKEGSNED